MWPAHLITAPVLFSPRHPQFDEGRAVFSGDYTVEDILTFVYGEQLPLLTIFSDEVSWWKLEAIGVSVSCKRDMCWEGKRVLLLRALSCNTHTHTQTAPKIFGGSQRTHLLAFYSSESEEAETLTATLKTVAAEFKGKVRGEATDLIPVLGWDWD